MFFCANVHTLFSIYKFFKNNFFIFAKNALPLYSLMPEPLAERLRPRSLDDYIGQEHLVGEGAVLRKMIDAGHISSFILWGPPGVGKTTLAHIIANRLQTPFYTLSAVTSGVKDVRERELRAECIPEAIVGEHVAIVNLPVVRTIIIRFAIAHEMAVFHTHEGRRRLTLLTGNNEHGRTGSQDKQSFIHQ